MAKQKHQDDQAPAEAQSEAPIAVAAPVKAESAADRTKREARELRDKMCDPENQVKCTFVDVDGSEYPARILPVATNKGTLIDIPGVRPENVSDEYKKLAALPVEKQLAAVGDLQKRMASTKKAIMINNQLRELAEIPGVGLCWTTEFKGMIVPCCDLMVNVSKKEGQEDLRLRSRILHKSAVGTPGEGRKGKAHFYLPS